MYSNSNSCSSNTAAVQRCKTFLLLLLLLLAVYKGSLSFIYTICMVVIPRLPVCPSLFENDVIYQGYVVYSVIMLKFSLLLYKKNTSLHVM